MRNPRNCSFVRFISRTNKRTNETVKMDRTHLEVGKGLDAADDNDVKCETKNIRKHMTRRAGISGAKIPSGLVAKFFFSLKYPKTRTLHFSKLVNTSSVHFLFCNLLSFSGKMALKAVHVSDVPSLDHVPENASLSLFSTRFSNGLFFSLSFLRIICFIHRNLVSNFFFFF